MEKWERREKECDWDLYWWEWSECEEWDESFVDKVDNEEWKGVNVEDIDMVKKFVDEWKLKEGCECVRERYRDKERDDDGEGGKCKKWGCD